MRAFPKPWVVVSRCLGFAPCRYDGSVIPNPVGAALQTHVEFVPVCPEVEIGLGVQRPPIRLVRDSPVRLIQPDTGQDLTAKTEAFAQVVLCAMPKSTSRRAGPPELVVPAFLVPRCARGSRPSRRG